MSYTKYQLICESINESATRPNYKLVKYTKEHARRYSHEMSLNHMMNGSFTKSTPDIPITIIIDTDADDWIGYISYEKNKKRILGLEINKKYHRMGFATLLLNLYKDAEVLYTKVDNEKARSLYEKNGWKDYNIRIGLKNDVIIMYSKIPPVKIIGKRVIVNVPAIRMYSRILAASKIGKMIKYSNKPNLELVRVEGKLYYKTLRELTKGEELTAGK